jgi:uncharacterized protein (DUF983 family)
LTPRAAVNPFLAGARGRCPNCGGGPLFEGFLRVRPACAACGFDLSASDSGDGPAVFVIIIAGFIAVFGAMFTMIAWPEAPIWTPLAIWVPAAAILCLALLRPMKGLMVAAHVRNRAGAP